jgi:glycosyltransferase involved in cell wall biosynthesis
MRIGVDLAFLAHGAQFTQRGVGRYTFQQLRAVFAGSAAHEYILLVPPSSRAGQALDWATAYPFVSLGQVPARPTSDPEGWRQACRRYRLDLLHLTTPLNTPLPTGIETPLIATFYDAIPLLYPHFYLPAHAAATDTYLEGANNLHQARHLIAISEEAKRQAECLFGFTPAAMTVAYPHADPIFHPIAREQARRTLGRLTAAIGLPDRFLLAVPAYHPSKNLSGLLDGYRALPERDRQGYPLVIACALDAREALGLRHMIARRGLTSQIWLTDAVSEMELAALYAIATVLIHVSHVEGFGLPVLEAMQTGTPVIASANTATAEIVGEAGWLVDPTSQEAIATAIASVIGAPAQAHSQGQEGMARARRFGPEALGRATLAAYTSTTQPALVYDPAHSVDQPSSGVWPTTHSPRRTLWVPQGHTPRPSIAVAASNLLGSIAGRRVLMDEALSLLGLSREGWVALVSAVRTALQAGDLIIAPVLLHVCGPGDDGLGSLPWPVFTRKELADWLGDGLQLHPLPVEASLRGSQHAEIWRTAMLAPGRQAPAPLPAGRLYLEGHVIESAMATITVSNEWPAWPQAATRLDQTRVARRRSADDDFVDGERAYFEAVTEGWLTPSYATSWPSPLRKVIRQWHRIVLLGRSQESQRRLIDWLTYQVRRARNLQQPLLPTSTDLVPWPTPERHA